MCRRSHTRRRRNDRGPSRGGRRTRTLTLREDQPSPTVGVIGTELLLSQAFDRGSFIELRHAVASRSAAAGLVGDRLDDFVVAVNELLTNAVRHGGGTGRVVLWHTDGSVVCEVSDDGGGLATDAPTRGVRPESGQPGGWGLWLAEELTDTFELATGAEGTLVRVSSQISLKRS